MKLYFLRHGKADWPDWTGTDDERPLTKKGRKETKRVARFLCRHGEEPEFILTSPLPRARQTAEAAAKKLGVEVRVEAALEKGFDLAALRRLLKRTEAKTIMLVGHEPDFSGVVAELTGGRVELRKSSVACVLLGEAKSAGVLAWLLPPALTKRRKA